MIEISRIETAEGFITDDGSTIHELAGRVSVPTANQSLAQATIDTGGETTEHFHIEAEEIYYLTDGSGRMRLGDEEFDVAAGDCIVIAPGAPHKLWNSGSEPLKLLCCCSPPYRPEDTVLVGG
jgi:mannose-6-phosphate isomerase-like protein (cupin superfamily)